MKTLAANKQREAAKQDATPQIKRLQLKTATYGLAAKDVATQEVICDTIMLENKLDAKVAVVTYEEAKDLIDMAKAMQPSPSLIPNFVMVLDPFKDTVEPQWLTDLPNAQKSDYVLEFQKVGMRKVKLLSIRAEGTATWEPKVAETIKHTVQPKDEIVVKLRIWRKFMDDKQWQKVSRKPEQALEHDKPFRTYGWIKLDEDTNQAKHHWLGYARLAKEDKEQILATSGHSLPIFAKLLQQFQAVDDQTPVKWIERNANESHKDYFLRAQEQAKTLKKGLVHRSGGGADLGLRGLDPPPRAKEAYCVVGAPFDWNEEDLRGLLE